VARGSTYVANPPYFEGMSMTPAPVGDIIEAKPLAILGDSITTDHISPAGSIKADSPAGTWLMEHQVSKADFNSYGARRGHHEVMMRGTFANIRIKNEMVPGIEGGMSRYGDEVMPIYDAAMRHKADGTALVVVAARNMARDRAATGQPKAPTCSESVPSLSRASSAFTARIWSAWASCRSSSRKGTRTTLGLTGDDSFTIKGVASLKPRQDVDGARNPQRRQHLHLRLRCAGSIPPMKSSIS
jgi:aconitate hydratase